MGDDGGWRREGLPEGIGVGKAQLTGVRKRSAAMQTVDVGKLRSMVIPVSHTCRASAQPFIFDSALELCGGTTSPRSHLPVRSQ